MKKKMLLSTVMSLLAQLVTVIYGFVLPRLILEQFGSEVNGLTQSIKQFLGIINFLDFGVGQVVRSALYSPLARNDTDQISSVMASGGKVYRRLAYMLAGYSLVLACLYPSFAAENFDWRFSSSLIVVMAISSFAQCYFGVISEQLLQADQKGYIVFSLQIVSNLANAVACVWLINRGASIHAVKLATSLVFLIRPVVMYLYIHKNYHINRKIQYSGEPIAQKWNGVAQHISAVVLDGTDTIVLTLFSTLSNVSVYSVYYMVIASIQRFYQAGTAGIQSAAGALWAKQDKDAINRMFSWVETGLHYLVIFLFSCTAMLVVPFVRVYTNGLSDAQYIQPVFAGILSLAYCIRSLRTPYNIWILAAGHYKQTQRCHITAAALNLVISVLAVSKWGLVGIAIGTLVAMVYQTGWMAVYCAKNLMDYPVHKVAKQFLVDAAVIALVAVAAQWVALPENSYLGWVLMAIQVALITAAITVAAAFITSRTKIVGFAKWILNRKK